MLAREVLQLPAKQPRNRQRTLALQESDHRGMLGQDLNTVLSS
jgi:hypothetical protein